MLISKKNTEAIQRVVDYTLGNEWNWISEALSNELEPNETVLWDALIVDNALNGGTPPHIRMMNGIEGIEVSEDGIITNKEEYFS
jgi:hypothetical protein